MVLRIRLSVCLCVCDCPVQSLSGIGRSSSTHCGCRLKNLRFTDLYLSVGHLDFLGESGKLAWKLGVHKGNSLSDTEISYLGFV